MAERVNVILNHLGQSSNEATKIFPSPAAARFKLTLDDPKGIFTDAQRVFYEKNGYIVFRKLIPDEDLDKYEKRFQDICDEKVPRGNMIMMKDVAFKGQKVQSSIHTITKIQQWQNDPVLFQYAQHPAITPVVEAFTGPHIKSIHSMMINKPPDSGKGSSRHPLHQDLWYFPFRPADRIVCSWTAMQKINRDNGCLVVSPGTHRNSPGGKLLKHGYPDWAGGVNKAYHGITDISSQDINLVHLDMEKGDTVFFHPLLIHGSGRNKTDHNRLSISVHFASASTDCIEVKGTIQEGVAEEIEQMAVKKMGMRIKFADIWRMKARMVQGKAGSW